MVSWSSERYAGLLCLRLGMRRSPSMLATVQLRVALYFVHLCLRCGRCELSMPAHPKGRLAYHLLNLVTAFAVEYVPQPGILCNVTLCECVLGATVPVASWMCNSIGCSCSSEATQVLLMLRSWVAWFLSLANSAVTRHLNLYLNLWYLVLLTCHSESRLLPTFIFLRAFSAIG